MGVLRIEVRIDPLVYKFEFLGPAFTDYRRCCRLLATWPALQRGQKLGPWDTDSSPPYTLLQSFFGKLTFEIVAFQRKLASVKAD